MGSRGPLRNPTSIRGQRERKRRSNRAETTPERPQRPDWLPEDLRESWDVLVADLEAAGVPLARVDARAIAMYLVTTNETAKAAVSGDLKTAARLGRDALTWGNQIGATPAARARMNVRPAKPKDSDDDPWERLG